MAISNDTRVRRLGFWKMRANALPFKMGLFPPVFHSCFSSKASSSISCNSAGV